MKTEKRSSYEQNRRDENLFQFTRTMLAILISVGITFIIIACVSKEPLEAIFTFVTGPFSTLRRFGNVLEAAIPILFTGLAACVMFQAKQFSLIADGAFYIGGFLAALVTIYCPFQGAGATVIALLAATALG
ncbi:MAG: ABC transporter permease, partial [Clostridiales bacterium]|nr:ABC transporter permease [Clostridiales bacterium]